MEKVVKLHVDPHSQQLRLPLFEPIPLPADRIVRVRDECYHIHMGLAGIGRGLLKA